jgi:hypothetical protein
MKITCCIASRGRPAALVGVVMAAHRLKSGDHPVNFLLGMDNDDPDLSKVISILDGAAPVEVSTGLGIPATRGLIENRMLKRAIEEGAEAVTFLTDRTFIITPQWDAVMAHACMSVPKRVVWWSCPEDSGCVIPIIPRQYAEVIDCKWDEGVHPFWWSDTYQQEIDLMINGMPSLKINAYYSGARSTTNNGRDFKFWLDVFIAMRPKRRAQAKVYAEHLGIPWPDQARAEDYFARYDAALAKRCEEFEKTFGDERPPSEAYSRAKAKAELLLKGIEI